ncbi:hypothetical protein NSE01_27860 [Novosphingobium sediminis]|uniref:DUF3617 domain-containing protein n=1 Tax=Novosphingobium sediminis TaxID=707214 RepID=A0A512AMP0_9SPHN|nr:DUF3617 domain-containing protein [Novosphingobium sediminis]GEO00954.1 hypothetical protein NSE01_27860 [Novosphingobium sediminis]
MRLPILPLIALSAALALGGCGSGKSVTATNESVSGVAKKVADAGLKFNPGRWDSTMKFVKMDMEGMPPEAKAMMSKILGKDRTFATCLTKEEAEKPDAKFFGQADERCKYDSFAMGGGKIDAKMTCKAEQGMQTMTMQGNYTAESYQMTMSINGAGPQGKAMSMEMQLNAKHNGECTGKEEG